MAFWSVQVSLGASVLFSYAACLGAHPELVPALWGDIPASWIPAYQVSMLFAAAGYFPMLVRLARVARDGALGERQAFGAVMAASIATLAPSVVWMPATVGYLLEGGAAMLMVVRVALVLVAVGTLALLALLARADVPDAGPRGRWAALVGGVFFAFQTVVLDGTLWNFHFPGG